MDRQKGPVAAPPTSPDADTDQGRSVWPGAEVWRTPDDVPRTERVLKSLTEFASSWRKQGRRKAVQVAGGPTTAVVIDPALLMEGGHNYSALLRVKAELSKLKVAHTCLASLTADAAVRQVAAAVLPTKGLWWRSSYTRPEFLNHVRAMADQFSLALNEQERPPDLLILHCCDSVQIRAVAHYYSEPSRIPTPHLLIWLLFRPNHLKPVDDPSVAAQIEEYRKAFAALKKAIGDDRKITVLCETAAMAAIYRDISGLDVGIAPCPNLAGAGGKELRGKKTTAARIATLGHANEAKGYHLLPEAIRHVLGSDDRATFFIHGTLQNTDADGGTAVFDALSKMGPRVVTSNDVLAPSEYLSRLLEADLLLLPYDNKTYETRGSGLFNEAREIGIPVIATRGCAFAQAAFDERWGVEIVEHSGQGIGRAILAALDRLPDLSARAEGAACQYRAADVGTILTRIVSGISPQERALRTAAVKCGPKTPPLPKSFLSDVHLDPRTSVRAKAPANRPLALRSIMGKLIATPPEPYCYAVLLSAKAKKMRELPAGSHVVADISLEVVAGRVGVCWVDEAHQVVDGTERYAPAMAGIQRLVVPVPSEKVHQLVFRNFAPEALPTSFRILELRTIQWAPKRRWREARQETRPFSAATFSSDR